MKRHTRRIHNPQTSNDVNILLNNDFRICTGDEQPSVIGVFQRLDEIGPFYVLVDEGNFFQILQSRLGLRVIDDHVEKFLGAASVTRGVRNSGEDNKHRAGDLQLIVHGHLQPMLHSKLDVHSLGKEGGL